jgi:hypothetical protein
LPAPDSASYVELNTRPLGGHVVELDFTLPVPVAGTPGVERVAHAIGRLRPQLLAYQFVAAAEPR